MKIKLIPFALVFMSLIVLSSCEKEESLEEKLTKDYFNLVDHCYEFGFIKFDSDNGGLYSVDNSCEYGYECKNVLPINWELNGSELTITFINNSATYLCSQLKPSDSELPSPETITISSNAETIQVKGHTFKR